MICHLKKSFSQLSELVESTILNEILLLLFSYGKIQSVKIHHRENEDVSSAIVAFGDIKSASKAHGAENRIEGNLLSTEYSEGSATGSAVTRTVEPRIGAYNRSFSRSKGYVLICCVILFHLIPIDFLYRRLY